MRSAWLIAAAASVLGGGAQAAELVLDGVVARVVVIPEARGDLQVQVRPGSGVPVPSVQRQGERWVVRGGQRVRGCSGPGEAMEIRLRGGGRLRMADAPVITVRAPRNVTISSEGDGAISGQIGPTQTLNLSGGGCSRWRVADVAGALDISQGGGAVATVGRAGSARIRASGGGRVEAGPVGRLAADASGGGVVRVASVSGPMSAEGSGGGGVRVDGGRTGLLRADASGGGWVDFRGVAEGLDAQASGGGSVKVAQVTGLVDRRHASGGGSIRVGR